MARPLPGRRGGLDPAQRADPRPGLGHDQGRAEGALGRAGREPLQPPDRRLRQRDPPGPAAARASTSATGRSRASTRCSRPTSAASGRRCWPTCGPSRPGARSTRSGTTAIYKYIASYHAIPGRGPRAVRIELELHANSGSMLNGQDDKDRVVNYEYSLVYGLDGRVDETNPYAADWISVGGEALFAPLNVLEVVGIALGRPQPAGDRGERPVARPGQRRRTPAGFARPAAGLPPGRAVRGRPPGDDRRRCSPSSNGTTRPRVAADSSATFFGR